MDLGPFKHTVDDALPLRKSSLSILQLCIDKSLTFMHEKDFFPLLQKALDDVEDIQLQGHQIVISLSLHHPEMIVSSIDLLLGPLERAINKKQAPKTGNEVDRGNETLKSALRVVMALNQVDGVGSR